MREKLTVGQLITLLQTYDNEKFVQLDFDTTNLNIRDTDYVGEEETAIGTIYLPTEYEYRK